MSFESTPTTFTQLVDGLEAVSAVQDPLPWDLQYYWPPTQDQQPTLVAAFLTAEHDEIRLVWSDPISDDEPDDQNFVVDLVGEDPGNVQHTSIIEVSLVGDYTVALMLNGELEEPGNPGVTYNGAHPPLVTSAAGKEALPTAITYVQED